MKDKQWKDYWDVSLGVSYISLEKIDPQTDLVELEEGGMFDEDTMPDWMKNIRSGANKPAPQTLIPDALGMPLQAHGVDPALMAALPTGPPPGVPPFGLPPGMPPPGAGLLVPPAGAPVMLPPGMMAPHRFGPPPPHGAPHGFPPGALDTSQPPPGMRMPFPPPNVVPNVEGQGDIEMEIEDQDEPRDQNRGPKGGPPQGGGRGSRWGNKENNDDNVQNRLRNLAGNAGGPPGGGPEGGMMDMPPWNENPPQDHGKCRFSSPTNQSGAKGHVTLLVSFDWSFVSGNHDSI